jgi:apolipoprotein N-acyltransferase
VENGVPLIRCTNNRLTCWVDSRGRLHDVYFPGSTDIYQAGFKIATIPLRAKNRPQTIYHRHGDFFGWACVALAIAMTIRSFCFRRSTRDTYISRNRQKNKV